MHGLNQVVY